MTPREHKVLMFISNYIAEHGYAPSYTEMSSGMGYGLHGRSGISVAINNLIRDGYLKKSEEKRARNLTVTRLPLGHTCAACGRAAA